MFVLYVLFSIDKIEILQFLVLQINKIKNYHITAIKRTVYVRMYIIISITNQICNPNVFQSRRKATKFDFAFKKQLNFHFPYQSYQVTSINISK